MPLSKRYIDTQEQTITVDMEGLRSLLKDSYPQIVFALIMGSASKGVIGSHSDLDLAVYTTDRLSFDDQCHLTTDVSRLHQDVRCDLGILNHAEPVYRFEALKGWLLFCRNEEQYLHFFSTTCRDYESQLFHYEKQRRYRLEGN